MGQRYLLVFSDPGGAKPCLALASAWSEADEVLICSDREYPFYEMFGLPVRSCKGEDAEKVIEEFQPDMVYTGTSYTSTIELEFLKSGIEKGIPTRSFVDHYTQFRERFLLGDELALPDQIDVLDERARQLATDAGLPSERIRITGNPYHEYLRAWKKQTSREELWKKLGFCEPKGPVLLFAPDPLSNAGGIEENGSDEAVVLRLLLNALNEVGLPFQLIIKAHPNQDLNYLKEVLIDTPKGMKADCIIVGSEVDSNLNELIGWSDLVIGMFSSFLIEAELLGRPTLRILCDLRIVDPLKGLLKGIEVKDAGLLASRLRKQLATPQLN